MNINRKALSVRQHLFASAFIGCAAIATGNVFSCFTWADETESAGDVKRDALIVRAIERMDGYEYWHDKDVTDAVTRHVNRARGTAEFLKLVNRFQPPGIQASLVEMVQTSQSNSDSVEALRLLIHRDDGRTAVQTKLRGDDEAVATRFASILGLLGNGRAINMLSGVLKNEKSAYGLRSAAVRGLAKNNLGATKLLEMAKAKTLPADVGLLAGGLLSQSNDEATRRQAAELLPLPAQENREPLAPLDQLAKSPGDLDRGLKLFRGVATCANCHVVNGFGKQVGPDLSEIGDKLSREAMFTSILAPSAGISHNYENYVALLDSGQVISGVLVSETDDQMILRTAEAIDRQLAKDEIEEVKKSDKSIMPENLHHTTDQQGLIDIVEYLMTLKKKPSSS